MDYYDLSSLSQSLSLFEERYGISSEDFYEGHKIDSPAVKKIPGFHRHLWASFYLDVRRMNGSDFVAGVERTLEYA
jgi:hypothetical protein